MNLLKKIGKGVKKLGKNIGKGFEKIDDIALPALGFALGGPAGAALGSAAARGIGDGKFNLGATLGAGAKGYVGGQVASGLGLAGGKGIGALGSSVRSAVTNPGASISRLAGVGGGGGAAGGAAPAAGGGGAGGLLGSVGGVRGAMDLGLGAMNMYQGAKSQGKADKMSDRALALAEQRYADLAPLRSKGLEGMLNPSTPDLSAMYAGSDNPFARPLRPLAPSMGATTPRGPEAMDPMERPMREVTRPRVSRLRGGSS